MEHVTEEKKYETIYGDTFALYSKKDMEEFIEPFELEKPALRKYGVDYDTGDPLDALPTQREMELMGEGDLRPLVDEFDGVSANNPWLRIAVASRVQRERRLLLTETRPFPLEELKALLDETLGLAKRSTSEQLGAPV